MTLKEAVESGKPFKRAARSRAHWIVWKYGEFRWYLARGKTEAARIIVRDALCDDWQTLPDQEPKP